MENYSKKQINTEDQLKQKIKALELELQKEKNYNSILLNTAHVIILILDISGKIVNFNTYMEEISGYKLAEVKGKDWFTTFLPSEDTTKIRNIFKQAINDIQTRGNINPIKTKSGELRQIEWYDKTLKNDKGKIIGIVAIGHDVTEKRVMLDLLVESENRFRKLAESAQDAIIMMDNRGNVSFWNNASTKIFGYLKEEAIGKNLHDFLAPDRFKEAHRKAFPHFQKTGKGTAVGKILELAAIRKNGKEFPIELSVAAVFLKEKWNAIGIIRDISDRKRKEKQIEDLAKFPEENKNPVFRVSKDGTLLYANSTSKKLIFADSLSKKKLLPKEWIDSIQDFIKYDKQFSFELKIEDRFYFFNAIPIKEAGYINIYGNDITNRVIVDTERKKLVHNLKERVKELKCIYAVTESIIKTDNIEKLLKRIISIIPFGWQYPKITKVRIFYNKKEFLSETFKRTQWKLSTPLVVNEKEIGLIEVYYSEERPELDEGPFLTEERNLLNTIALELREGIEKKLSEIEIQKKRVEIKKANKHAMYMLAVASEHRDTDTGNHIKRIGDLTTKIALNLDFEAKDAEQMGLDSLLHDLGKIGIPDSILLKKGKLSKEEFALIKQHTLIGAKIIGNDNWFKQAREIALYHHEQWNGKGYPKGLKEDKIPIAARIVAVSDVYDALTTERPYKKAWTKEQALKEIESESGKHFDPKVVKAFLSVMRPKNKA